MTTVEIGSTMFTYAGPHFTMYQSVSVVVTRQDKDDPTRYRIKYTSNEIGSLGKFDWTNSRYLFASRESALIAAADSVAASAARMLEDSERYRAMAAMQRDAAES